ncbi:FAD-dependent monooxygenase [Verrucomicrobiota bacterium sgz303538]
MEQSTPDTVLISGAGPVGLALALGLSRYGIHVEVFEKKTELSKHSRALLITTRTLEVLRGWNVLDRFLAVTDLVSKISVHVVGDSEPKATLDFSPLERIATIRGAMLLPQDRTEALLLDAVREAGVAVYFDHEFTGFQQDEDGVTIEVSSQGERKQFRGAYLIGCDGAHSTVRERLGWHLEGKTYPSRIMLADVRLPDERGDAPWPLVAPQPRGALAGLRFAPRTWRIISTIDPDETDEEALRPEKITVKVERLFGAGPYENIWASVFRIHCRNSPHFRLNRVLLAGDAAHVNSPAGGQGMNAGIHDAQNLAWKLVRAIRGGNVEALISSYEQERREVVVSTVERFTDMLTRLAFMSWPQVRFLVLQMVRTVLNNPLVNEQAIRRFAMLTARYHHSALLDHGGIHAGKRAPDGEVENSEGVRRPLYMVAPLKAVLVLFDDRRVPGWNVQAMREALANVPDLEIVRLLPSDATPREEGEWRDVNGTLWREWYASADFAVLIRPDNHVGWSRRRPTQEELVEGVRAALGAK